MRGTQRELGQKLRSSIRAHKTVKGAQSEQKTEFARLDLSAHAQRDKKKMNNAHR